MQSLLFLACYPTVSNLYFFKIQGQTNNLAWQNVLNSVVHMEYSDLRQRIFKHQLAL